jgi:hypothetical protein
MQTKQTNACILHGKCCLALPTSPKHAIRAATLTALLRIENLERVGERLVALKQLFPSCDVDMLATVQPAVYLLKVGGCSHGS